ncbi:MAG: thiamine-phosphate kinase [Chloroflexi bacterium]|nr:thiamine-phosphate kinase [Chloroflexota bacterium]
MAEPATVAGIGEFGLIERIAGIISKNPDPEGVVVGIGDDAAALEFPPQSLVLATTDIMIENVHFQLGAQTPRDLGRRVMVINVSDIAAMGGLPRYALLSLGLTPDIPVSFIEEFYAGVGVEAKLFGFGVVGGNIARSPERLILDVTMLGMVEPARVVRRSGARPGDQIMVTGNLGSSAAGLAIILDHLHDRLPHEVVQYLKAAHNLPRPRVAEGRLLAESGCCTAMIDISDGLASDLNHICEQSQVGAVIFESALPIADATRALAGAVQKPVSEYALFGGEEYELLFTVRPGCAESLALALRGATGILATTIGEVLPAELGMRVEREDGHRFDLPPRGFDHLMSASQ